MLKRATLLMISAIAVSLLMAQATAKPKTVPAPLPTAVNPPTLVITPQQQSCPAGADVIYQLSSRTTESYSDFSIQGLPPGITGEIRKSLHINESELLIHVNELVPPGLYTAQVLAHTRDYPNTVIRPLSLEVTPCTESVGGHFVQKLDDPQRKLVLKGSDGRALYYPSVIIPFQVCNDRATHRLAITLEKIDMDDLAAKAGPPAFLLLRSLAYPALNDAVVVGVSGFNAQQVSLSPRFTSTGLQLSADVTPGLYLLAFRRDYPYKQATLPITVTYNVELTH